MKRPLTFITRAALIAALYFALTAAVSAISFGPLQFRLSEALVLLAALMPEAIPGLTIGCLLSNLAFSPYSLYDMIFGGLATFLGCVGSYLLRKNLPLAALPPIIFNALLVPIIFVIDGGEAIYYISALEIFASEFIIVGVIGIPFTYAVKRGLTHAGVLKPEIKLDAMPYKREFPKPKTNCEESEDVTIDTTSNGTEFIRCAADEKKSKPDETRE